MSEDAFLTSVVNLARMLGWMAAHHDKSARKVGDRWISNIRGDKGSPDLLLVRAPRIIFAELKTGKKYGTGRKVGGSSSYGLTLEQKRWLGELSRCPVETYTWTPADIDTIADVLKAA